jgi:succinyl-CoA synthetase beta subunit
MVDVGTAPTPKALGPALDEAAGAEGTRVVLASLVGLVHPCPELAEAVAAWHAAHPKARLVARLSGSEEAEARAFLERAGVEAAPSAEEAARIAAGGGRR